ncbi:uncharacterized protein N7511_006182 [Penicillium nucicola]|uniref:uncharacterized protein n=1 Tax=Penicillium nucicola TaxID=1850975 RepID=UPI0025453B84|nr:uncharacterized protein N7511_006182 [Penicillium nucicola]KAJ5757488.1 hypothetical protein N7511_006182 [Penicillium nucicola]
MSHSIEEDKAQAIHSDNGNLICVDAEAEKKLVWKIDLYLMPSVFVLYLFSYVDRSNIGLAKIAGMEEDLKLTSDQYYTAVIHDTISHSAIDFHSDHHIRMGYCRSANWNSPTPKPTDSPQVPSGEPAVIFLISTWYRKNEQSKRFIIFLSAGILSGAFGSIVSGAITSTLDGIHNIRGWRWLFIVEGAATAGMSLIAHWTLLDFPNSSRGLTPDEQKLAQHRLIEDGIANEETTDPAAHQTTPILQTLLKALSDWRAWILTPAYMSILGALAISYFYPTLIAGMGYTSTTAQYMTAPLYLVSLVIAIPVCYLADRNPNRRGIFLVTNLLVGMIFFALTAAIADYTARYVFLCFINVTIWTGNALALSFATTALAAVDRDVRAVMLAWMNGVAALAQLYGSALFPAGDSPGYVVGFSVFAGTFAVGAVLYGVADVLMRRFPYKV